MKLTKIEIGMHYRGYGEGAEPGIKCEVEFRIPGSYSSAKVKLTDEQTKEVVALAARLALTQFDFDAGGIDVVGTEGKPRPVPEPPSDEIFVNRSEILLSEEPL